MAHHSKHWLSGFQHLPESGRCEPQSFPVGDSSRPEKQSWTEPVIRDMAQRCRGSRGQHGTQIGAGSQPAFRSDSAITAPARSRLSPASPEFNQAGEYVPVFHAEQRAVNWRQAAQYFKKLKFGLSCWLTGHAHIVVRRFKRCQLRSCQCARTPSLCDCAKRRVAACAATRNAQSSASSINRSVL